MTISLPGLPASPPLRLLRAVVIFNPSAGDPQESPYQLLDILSRLQVERIAPEVYLVSPDTDLRPVVRSALRRGIRLFIVSGGDGTIESIAGALIGTDAVLAIIPTGTRNNIALALNIPPNIPESTALIRQGEVLRMDVGRAHCGHLGRWFLETASIGLVPALYPAADDIQHGDLIRVGDLLAALFNSPQAELRLILDDRRVEVATAHMALVANAPYFGPNFQISPDISFMDQWLDVFVFSDLSKLELVGYAVTLNMVGIEDPRILHYRARKVVIQSAPRMPVMADGFSLREGSLVATLHPQALRVISGRPAFPPDRPDEMEAGLA